MENHQYLDAVVDMIRTIFKDDKVGGIDRICGCKLAEILMLNLRGGIDNYVPEFIGMAMIILSSDELKVKSYRIHLMEMVINAIYYNPRLSVHVLESNGWTNKFFSLWFSSIDSFTRVHDKKLSIGAITQLLTLRADEVPQSVQQGWPRLLQGVTRLFQTLPAALKNREEAQREEDFGLGDDFDDEEEDDEWEGEDWDHEETEEAIDVKDESTAYLDFLSQQASKFNSVAGDDDEDDELEEESLLETPLDQMEPYGLFKAALQCKFPTDIPLLHPQCANKNSFQPSPNRNPSSMPSSPPPFRPKSSKSSRPLSRRQTRSRWHRHRLSKKVGHLPSSTVLELSVLCDLKATGPTPLAKLD